MKGRQGAEPRASRMALRGPCHHALRLQLPWNTLRDPCLHVLVTSRLSMLIGVAETLSVVWRAHCIRVVLHWVQILWLILLTWLLSSVRAQEVLWSPIPAPQNVRVC